MTESATARLRTHSSSDLHKAEPDELTGLAFYYFRYLSAHFVSAAQSLAQASASPHRCCSRPLSAQGARTHDGRHKTCSLCLARSIELPAPIRMIMAVGDLGEVQVVSRCKSFPSESCCEALHSPLGIDQTTVLSMYKEGYSNR